MIRFILAGAWSLVVTLAAMQFTTNTAERITVLLLAAVPLAVLIHAQRSQDKRKKD